MPPTLVLSYGLGFPQMRWSAGEIVSHNSGGVERRGCSVKGCEWGELPPPLLPPLAPGKGRALFPALEGREALALPLAPQLLGMEGGPSVQPAGIGLAAQLDLTSLAD